MWSFMSWLQEWMLCVGCVSRRVLCGWSLMCGWYLMCGCGTCAIEYVCVCVMQHVSENTSPIVIISCFAEEWMLVWCVSRVHVSGIWYVGMWSVPLLMCLWCSVWACVRVYACALCLKGAAFVCLFFPLDERRYKHSTGPVWMLVGMCV